MAYRDLLTVKEFCDILHIGRQSVYKWIKEGRIPAFKNPVGKYLIPRKYVEDLIVSCYTSSSVSGEGA